MPVVFDKLVAPYLKPPSTVKYNFLNNLTSPPKPNINKALNLVVLTWLYDKLFVICSFIIDKFVCSDKTNIPLAPKAVYKFIFLPFTKYHFASTGTCSVFILDV